MDGFDGSDGFDGFDVWGTAPRWRVLRSETLVYALEGLAVMRWIFSSGDTPKIWLCSSTNLAREAVGSRSSRRVDDANVEKELMGCQIWAMVVTMPGWLRWRRWRRWCG